MNRDIVHTTNWMKWDRVTKARREAKASKINLVLLAGQIVFTLLAIWVFVCLVAAALG